MLKFYCEEAGRALAELKSTPDGLTDAEAARRLAEKGPNKLAEGKKVTTLQRFLQQLSDPMIIILLVAGAVSGVTAAYSGESFADVFIILIVVLINAVLGVYQESKAEKAIEALQEMTAATSKVIRGGKQVSLKSEELVPGRRCRSGSRRRRARRRPHSGERQPEDRGSRAHGRKRTREQSRFRTGPRRRQGRPPGATAKTWPIWAAP